MYYRISEDFSHILSLEQTLLSRILLRLVLPLQHFRSSLVTLRQPQGGSARSRYAAMIAKGN
jgi:hypothetical protein